MEECLVWIRKHAPEYDAVGLAAAQCNVWETAQIIAREVKALGLPLVAGGPFVTTATDEAFAKFGMDIAVLHEGEWIAEEAFTRAVAGETGVVLDGSAEPHDFSEVPVPNWDLLDMPIDVYPRYNGRMRGVLTVSRGCPHLCEFCSVHTIMGRRHRRFDRSRIKTELLNLYRRGVRYICFLDDNLFISERALNILLGAIDELDRETSGFEKTRFYVEEGIEVRVAARPGFFDRLASGRWENLALGLETANTEVARGVRKPYTDEDLQNAIENCRRSNVVARAFYVIGLPGDTLDSVAQDLIRFAGFGMSVRSNNLKLYPGTETTEKFRRAGKIRDTYDWRLSTFYTPDTSNLTYSMIRALKTVLNAIGMSQERFCVNPFVDSISDIETRVGEAGLRLSVGRGGGVIISGNMYRSTPYRVLAEILCARCSDAPGATSVVGKNVVRATPSNTPRNEVQGAIIAAMRGQRQKSTGLGLE